MSQKLYKELNKTLKCNLLSFYKQFSSAFYIPNYKKYIPLYDDMHASFLKLFFGNKLAFKPTNSNDFLKSGDFWAKSLHSDSWINDLVVNDGIKLINTQGINKKVDELFNSGDTHESKCRLITHDCPAFKNIIVLNSYVFAAFVNFSNTPEKQDYAFEVTENRIMAGIKKLSDIPERILIPLNAFNHWLLIEIDLKSYQVIGYDSLHSEETPAKKLLFKKLINGLKGCKKLRDLHLKYAKLHGSTQGVSLKLKKDRNVMIQENDYDGGLYMLFNIFALVHNQSLKSICKSSDGKRNAVFLAILKNDAWFLKNASICSISNFA